MGLIWTAELKATAIDLWKTHSAREITVALKRQGIDVTRNSVLGMLFRAGITATGLSRVRTERAHSAPKLRRVAPQFARKPPRQYDPEKIKLRCAGIVPHHVDLMDRAANGCCYPFGDGPFTYCNHERREDSSYCGPHHDLMHVPSIRRAA